MLLITEHTEDINLITEEVDGEKQYHIDGIFMQAEQKNRNGRVYPKKTLMNEVARYNKEYVMPSRAMGELGHPEGPQLNLERVSHLIKELRVDGNDVYGKAKILDTPYGKIVKDLIKEGVKIGVSSRGMGSLKQVNGVNEAQKISHFQPLILSLIHLHRTHMFKVLWKAKSGCGKTVFSPLDVLNLTKSISNVLRDHNLRKRNCMRSQISSQI